MIPQRFWESPPPPSGAGDSAEGSGDIARCSGDFTGDGAVNFFDLVLLAQRDGDHPTLSTSGFTHAFAADWAIAQSLVPEPITTCSKSYVCDSHAGTTVRPRSLHPDDSHPMSYDLSRAATCS